MRRFFDPAHYRVVLFDQRGCGRSTPNASVENNTTWDLVADIERIRAELGIDDWAVFGGSWGACLGLVYAQTHPERVRALVLRGVFTMTRAELDWFYGGGAGGFWPDQWAAFAGMIPEGERHDLIAAYNRRLFGEDEGEQVRFARAWAGWESALAVLDPGEARGYPSAGYALAFARLENHYFINGGFLDGDGHVLRHMHRIAHVPGAYRAGPLRHDLPAAHRAPAARRLAGLDAPDGDRGRARAVGAGDQRRARRGDGPAAGVRGAARGSEGEIMEIDRDKIDDAVLALLYLTLDRDGRAWKGFDWDVMDRLHAKGFIANPKIKAKSVWLTEEGAARSERLFGEMFGKA